MLGVGNYLVAGVGLVPLPGRNLIFVATVIEVREVGIVRLGRDFACYDLERLRQPLLDALLLGHELGIAAQQNVGAAAGHVGRNSNCTFAACLGNDLGFLLVVLGIQDHVLPKTLLVQQGGNPFLFFDRPCSFQHGLAGLR